QSNRDSRNAKQDRCADGQDRTASLSAPDHTKTSGKLKPVLQLLRTPSKEFHMKRTTIVCLTASCVLALVGCAQRTVARSRTSASPGPTTVSSSTPGVIPSGTNLEVRTNQDISANKDSVGRTYSGEVATDIVNTSGTVQCPKGSPLQRVVLSIGEAELPSAEKCN